MRLMSICRSCASLPTGGILPVNFPVQRRMLLLGLPALRACSHEAGMVSTMCHVRLEWWHTRQKFCTTSRGPQIRGLCTLFVPPWKRAFSLGFCPLQIFGKGAKFSMFKPAEEMVYIGLDEESRTKGKAAIDVVGAQSGKSLGSVLQQALLLATGGALAGASGSGFRIKVTVV